MGRPLWDAHYGTPIMGPARFGTAVGRDPCELSKFDVQAAADL